MVRAARFVLSPARPRHTVSIRRMEQAMAAMKEKGLEFFAILEALRTAQRCPLCELEARGVQRYFDSLLYESVNDPGARARLREARGYCGRHAHMLLRFRNGLATAILYREQLEEFARYLATAPARRSPGKRSHSRGTWAREELCPACAVQMTLRACYQDVLGAWLCEEPLRAAFAQAHALCVPHFLMCEEHMRIPETRRFLREVQARKVALLLQDLAEFIRKHDYRFSAEGFGKEGTAWTEALLMMAGAEEVFAP